MIEIKILSVLLVEETWRTKNHGNSRKKIRFKQPVVVTTYDR